MNITELSVKRPSAIIMLFVLFIGLGVMGYTNLGANLFPTANTPILSISTTYPGSGPQEIENDIIRPIEDELSGISGIDTMRSYAEDGYGYTIVQFTMSTDINTAVLDVQKALESIAGSLPEDASRPVIRKFDINNEPILILSVSGEASYEALYPHADRLKRSIERLSGVGSVSLQGDRERYLSVKLDKALLEAYGIDINAVISRLRVENLNVPAGQIKQDARMQTVRALGEFSGVEEVQKLWIPLAGGGYVPLSEIAEVKLDYPEDYQTIRLNGEQSIGIYIHKQSDANVVATATLVKKELDSLRKTLPPDMKLVVATDATTFINSSLNETIHNLLEGIVTTAIVLFLFLRQWRSSLIVLVAIPTSLISTFFMMYVLDFSFNIVSLMGLAMCVGILVDDSIVILENIHRHLKQGKDPVRAAVEGRKEIGMAAVAITLCDVVVFAPVAFMSDLVGQFFREFGLTVVFATLFSLLVSFTLTPMLASRLLKPGDGEQTPERGKSGRFAVFFETVLKKKYRNFLSWSLDHRWRIIGIITAGVLLSILLIPLKYIGTEFLPPFDQNKLLVNISLSPGSTLRQTDEKTRRVEEHLRSLPEVRDYFTAVGTENTFNTASITVNLVGKNERKKSQTQLALEIRSWGKTLTGMDFSVTEPSIVERTSIEGTKPIILNITGQNMDVLKELSKKVEQIVRSTQGTVDVENSILASQPEVSVRIDRSAAFEYGVTAYDIAQTVRAAIAGTKAGVYRKNGDEYDIMVKFRDDQVKTAADIGSIRLSNTLGQQIPLHQVAAVYPSDSPQEILRLDRQYVVTIAANMQGRALGTINSEIRERLTALNLPYGYEIQFGGDQQHMSTSFASLIKALVASILLVYMILVVLYESFLTPLIRMLSLPCGIIGALVALALTGKSLNIISMIGLIMLDGLASKNGTLLIDYAHTLMKHGMPLREALLESGLTRLRPIIMTSVTMIVGMLPLALAISDGSEIRSGMAVALIGGLTTSTILSPILLPVAYTLIEDIRHRKKGAKENHSSISGGAAI